MQSVYVQLFLGGQVGILGSTILAPDEKIALNFQDYFNGVNAYLIKTLIRIHFELNSTSFT